MGLMLRLFSCFFLSLLSLQAAESTGTEMGAFSSAAKAFQDGLYARAESEFAAFGQQYTNSSRLPEAILIQAQARMQLTNDGGAIDLLKQHFGQSGQLAPE